MAMAYGSREHGTWRAGSARRAMGGRWMGAGKIMSGGERDVSHARNEM